MASFPLVSATGFRAKTLDEAISLGARIFGCDAGSTDPGPGPLATGTCMFSAAAVKRDTEIMMTRARQARHPSDHTGADRQLARATRRQHQDAHRQHGRRTRVRNRHRVYGRDGVMVALEPQRHIAGGVGGYEAFILWDVISELQDLSRTIATSLSHLAVHNPILKWHGLISGVAFPYSPPEIDRGRVYEFHLNHLLVPDSPTALFRTEYEEL